MCRSHGKGGRRKEGGGGEDIVDSFLIIKEAIEGEVITERTVAPSHSLGIGSVTQTPLSRFHLQPTGDQISKRNLGGQISKP